MVQTPVGIHDRRNVSTDPHQPQKLHRYDPRDKRPQKVLLYLSRSAGASAEASRGG